MNPQLIEAIKREEGWNSHAYICPAGKWTIGYGRNIDPAGGKGIIKAEGAMLLRNDILDCLADLESIFDNWPHIDRVRQNALANMRYQLGPSRFRSFAKMIAAVRGGNWMLAYLEALDSKWASVDQTPERAIRVARAIRDGVLL